MSRFRAFASVLLAAAFATASVAVADDRATPRCFRVFDGTMYADRPDLRAFGVEPALVPTAYFWWRDGESRQQPPSLRSVRAWVADQAVRDAVLAIDLEWWPVRGTQAQVLESVTRYRELLQLTRKAGYTGPIGFYAVPPVGDYWRAIRGENSPQYQEWRAENDAVADLAADVDVLFPSLYTFYDDPARWERYAIANIRESRRLAPGKPVYAFIWPQYHDSNKELGLDWIPEETWARQLRVLAQHADGVVIWGGWNFSRRRPLNWNERAPWWRATRAFLAQAPLCPSARGQG
jgi:hypothetical protein